MGLLGCDEACFSDDMFVEILTRLPLKPYSRSKCVSKSWQALLSHDYLRSKLPLIVSGVIQPSQSSLKNKPMYVSNLDSNFEPTSLDFFPFRYYSTLIDCCNGLLLFYSSIAKTFYVCNPTTKRYVSLPKPSKETQLSILAFDPYHSKHFKVVSFNGWLDHGAKIEVFDSKFRNWIEHKVNWGLNTNTLSSTMRYMDGVLYIIAAPKQVVAIDMNDTMTCGVIELPEIAKTQCCMGKVEGRLHYCTYDGNRLRTWMLSEVMKGEWVLKHNVSISTDIMGNIRVLGLHPERENVIYLSAKDNLVAYDVCEERAEEVWEIGKDNGYLIQIWAFPFSRHMEDCLAGSSI